jgi:microcystin-dependent protein
MDAFIGEIRLMSFPFAPRGWAYCQGQLLQVQQYQALFSLLGTTYGGNGQTTFGLPDLRGRVAVGNGQGAGLSAYAMGQRSGQEGLPLTINQIPAHVHTFNGSILTADELAGQSPINSYPAAADPTNITPYASGTPNASMSTAALPNITTSMGGSQAHENRQPLLALNYAIALTGYFPSRQ